MKHLKESDEELKNEIKTKRKKLQIAKSQLKEHFVDIDNAIDKIFSIIETWYILPDILTRPTIIPLWGPTGVGKTDLVRRLVKALDFADRYCEIEMSNQGASSYPFHNCISTILGQHANISPNESCVILIDEMQNFRTVDEEGREISDYKMRDIWALLSDGKLPFKVDVDYLTHLLWEFDNATQKLRPISPMSQCSEEMENYSHELDMQEVSAIDMPFKSNDLLNNNHYIEKWDYYSLTTFKAMLRLEDPIEEIAKWSKEKKRQVVVQSLNGKMLYEEENYSKSLIFVAGNLDEAYSFAKEVDEVDVDADIFHNMSLRISLLDIKHALTQRFKPEQIARLGNNHVVYNALSKNGYEELISRKICEIQHHLKDTLDISLDVDETINQLIYDNGVFPAQGTRPVFSTISEIIEGSLPRILLKALAEKKNHINMSYNGKAIVGVVEDGTVNIGYDGSMDLLKRKRNRNVNRRVLAATHEAGHALVYAIRFGAAPQKIVASPASPKTEGFIYLHDNCGSRYYLSSKISVLLAGKEAEELVFGSESTTFGSANDLKEATNMAANMVRHFGMDSFNSYILSNFKSETSNTDVKESNRSIEDIMKSLKSEARDIIKDHLGLFLDTIDLLMKQEKVTPEQYVELCDNHGVKIKTIRADEEIYMDYYEDYKNFKKANKSDQVCIGKSRPIQTKT